MGGKSSKLTKAINSTGMNTTEFANKVLGLKYSTFTYRIRNKCLSLDDYIKIIETTGRSFEELFMGAEFKLETNKIFRQPDESRVLVKEYHPPETKKEPEVAPFIADDIDFTVP